MENESCFQYLYQEWYYGRLPTHLWVEMKRRYELTFGKPFDSTGVKIS